MFEDYHVHTDFSNDSIYPMEKVVQDAIAMGMDEICFTEHIDLDTKVDRDTLTPEQIASAGKSSASGKAGLILNPDYPAYFKELARLKELYNKQIKIKEGMEFGIQSHNTDRYQAIFDKYKDHWDFIILSIHQVGNKEFYTYEFQEGKSQEQYNREYYEELLKVVQTYKDYSVLGHMDLILRYDKQGKYPFEKVKDLIEEILKQVIKDGKGIEINTSSTRYNIGDLTPSKDILKLYKELGGTILTFGSDSHAPNHLGKDIQEQKQIAKDLGFTHYCTYEKMQPIFHAL
jgi:histidinol-phosphatase (PHP family)